MASRSCSRRMHWSWVQAGRFEERRVRAEIAAVDASDEAKEVFADVALSTPFKDFLTTSAYGRLA